MTLKAGIRLKIQFLKHEMNDFSIFIRRHDVTYEMVFLTEIDSSDDNFEQDVSVFVSEIVSNGHKDELEDICNGIGRSI